MPACPLRKYKAFICDYAPPPCHLRKSKPLFARRQIPLRLRVTYECPAVPFTSYFSLPTPRCRPLALDSRPSTLPAPCQFEEASGQLGARAGILMFEEYVRLLPILGFQLLN